MTLRCISLPRFLPLCGSSNCVRIQISHSSQSRETFTFSDKNLCASTKNFANTFTCLLNSTRSNKNTSKKCSSFESHHTDIDPHLTPYYSASLQPPHTIFNSQQPDYGNSSIEYDTTSHLHNNLTNNRSSKRYSKHFSQLKSTRATATAPKQCKAVLQKSDIWASQFNSSLQCNGLGSGITIRGLHTTPRCRDIYIIENEEEFERKVMGSSLPVVINFHADWCEPCHALKPLLEGLAKKFQGKLHLAEIKVDDHVTLLRTFEVTAVPAVLGIVKGQVTEKFIGLISEAEVRAFINSMIEEA